jgi:hypothetical protein
MYRYEVKIMLRDIKSQMVSRINVMKLGIDVLKNQNEK